MMVTSVARLLEAIADGTADFVDRVVVDIPGRHSNSTVRDLRHVDHAVAEVGDPGAGVVGHACHRGSRSRPDVAIGQGWIRRAHADAVVRGTEPGTVFCVLFSV